MNYYVYILECSDGSYYTGVTNNIERRFNEHVTGASETCYTFQRRPLKLVFHYSFADPKQAIAFEKQVKGWGRKKKLALIQGDWLAIKEMVKEESIRRGVQAMKKE